MAPCALADVETSAFKQTPASGDESLDLLKFNDRSKNTHFDQVSTVAGSASASPCSEVNWRTRLSHLDDEWMSYVDRLAPYRSYARGAQARDFVVTYIREPEGDTSGASSVRCLMGPGQEICSFLVPHGVCHGAWLRDALSRKIECTAAFRLKLVDQRGNVRWETDGDEDVSDLHLLACFLELSQLCHADKSSVKLLFKSVKFLRSCQYTSDSICSVLAHASSYFVQWRAQIKAELAEAETGNILATFMFIAHSHVNDETCPLKHWHTHLFKRYCPLKMLNQAVMALLEQRAYRLRLAEDHLLGSYSALTRAMWTP